MAHSTNDKHSGQDGMTAIQIDDPTKQVKRPVARQRGQRIDRFSRLGGSSGQHAREVVRGVLITGVFLLAAVGFVLFNIGAARTISDYGEMFRAAQLSAGIRHLMHAYDGCRWAVFATGLAALLAFPAVMAAAALSNSIFISAWGRAERDGLKRRSCCVRAALILLALICAVASVTAVISIGVNVKASDKVSEVEARIQSGTALLNQASATIAALQSSSNSSSTVAGLVTSVLGALTGSSPNTATSTTSSALANLASTEDLTTLYAMISPLTVSSLVSALDPSPQGLLQLMAFLASKVGNSSSPGLACGAGCLNQVDACICSVNQLPILLYQQRSAHTQISLSLVGSCITAAGFALLLVISSLEHAKYAFQQRLVFGDTFDRVIACKHAILARSNASLEGISSPAVPANKAVDGIALPINAQAADL